MPPTLCETGCSLRLSRLIEPFEQALHSLEEQWSGTSAIRMTEVAVKFRDWLDTLIRQILATHEQIECLVDAFSCAREMTVHPERMYRNRTAKVQQILTNVAGQNAADIADLEDQYSKYCAKNQEAMMTYAAQVSDELSKLPSWEPPPIASAAGLFKDAATV
ncbi:PPE family protein [Mycobacterium haemophilum]|uniref:PPE family protein n=1 Tax=Mycobacterium haemophilum TaxID=29311 RepID=UPI001F1C8C9D|nr:PPE family protein [Mycobacterium haemophilum]